MKAHQILFAGFGGQGIQFAGKLLAYVGMYTGREVSLIPSYGPEMRGGTSNCSVQISEDFIASPLVTNPSVLVVMNGPSFDMFEKTALPGAKIFVDTTMISRKGTRDDVTYFYLPATKTASENKCLANVILCGKVLKETELCDAETARPIVEKLVPPGKRELFDINMKALELGFSF